MIALVFLLAAAAPQNAMVTYETCLSDTAETLDDHLSDAATIARAVAADCREDRLDFILKFAPPGQPAAMTQAQIDDATQAGNDALHAVLMERARRRDHLPARR